jgi:hypothetical protein
LEIISLETNQQYNSNRYLTIIHDANEGCVTVSDNNPACERLDPVKVIEIWEMNAFEKFGETRI